MKNLLLISLVLIVQLAFSQTASSFDLSGILIGSITQRVMPNANSIQSAIKPNANADKLKANTVNFCERVQSNEIYKQYAKMTGDAARNKYLIEETNAHSSNNNDALFKSDDALFESKDALLISWMRVKKIGAITDIGADAVKVVEDCTDQLLNEDLAYIFFRPDVVDKLRKLYVENPNQLLNVETVRRISASGEITEDKVISQQYNSIDNYQSLRTKALLGEAHPHWLALLYEGEKILSVTGSEYNKEYESKLLARKISNEEYRIAEEKKLLNQEENKLRNQAAETEKAEKMIRIRAGNYQIAESCHELAEALNIQNNNDVSALVQADDRLRFVWATLEEFDEGSILGKGLMRDFLRNKYAAFTSNNKTKWIGKRYTSIGGRVYVVGKYSSNKKITLTSGAGETIQQLEAICIQGM